MDRERFEQARETVLGKGLRDSGIGTLGEKSIHAVLKSYYEPYADSHEQRIGSCYADIIGENGIIEIQSRQFYRLRRKLELFLPLAHVTIVYPLILRKRLNWVDPSSGEIVRQGRFFRAGSIYSFFTELYGIKPFLREPNLAFRVAGLEIEEYRLLDGHGKDKRKGGTKVDKFPTALLEEWELSGKADFASWVPETLPEQFTSKAFAAEARIPLRTAQVTLNVLTELEVVTHDGRQEHTILYRRMEEAATC